jgi:hypothetical protein
VKASAGVLVAITVLSLGVWSLFYVLTPGQPLEAGETLVVVGACALLVLLARWLLGRRGRPEGGDR